MHTFDNLHGTDVPRVKNSVSLLLRIYHIPAGPSGAVFVYADITRSHNDLAPKILFRPEWSEGFSRV
jgi:hypothetical protein